MKNPHDERSPTATGVQQQYEPDREPLLQTDDSARVRVECPASDCSTDSRSAIRRVINKHTNSYRNRFVVLLGLVTICAAQIPTAFGAGPGASAGVVGVLYDSRYPVQDRLYKAAWMGLRDTIASDAQESAPLLLDLHGASEAKAAAWLHANRTASIVSLLDEETLALVLDSYASVTPAQQLRVVLPRSCPNLRAYLQIKVECLQMGDRSVATALLHRVVKVGTKTLIPIVDGSGVRQSGQQLELLQVYKKAIQSAGLDLELQTPIVGLASLKKKLMLYSRMYGNDTSGVSLLILARGTKAMIRALGSVSGTAYHTFSPYGTGEMLASNGTEISRGLTQFPFGVYTAEYVGSTEWDNPARRRILVELNTFMGPHPLILTAVLAYDAAARAVTGKDRLPLTGLLDLTPDGKRASGVFFGLTPKPSTSPSSLALLLQPSDFILQDMITLMPTREPDVYAVVGYSVSTSSMLSHEELLTLALLARSKYGCSEHGLEATTHDPFNQLAYTFNFLPETLPPYLLIPNQYGYGLELSCQTGAATTTSILIACTPNGQSLEEPVHCFRSNPHQRTKRHVPVPAYGQYGGVNEKQQYFQPYDPRSSTTEAGQQYYPRSYYYPYNKNYIARDDNANNLYYQPPEGVYGAPVQSSSAQPPNYYGYPEVSSVPPPNGYYGYPDSSTAGYLTTRLDIPINEEPSTTTPATPGASKLPELRQVLKAAKPFVGSCVGSTTGCAVCVLVLGRLPLGAVPAACTGPCFVGTFGSCGSLLGRVFSETTIICTELFKQGHLDIATFIADAEFGRLIAQQAPETLKGYQFLATPLVHTMKTSVFVTKVVAKFATAWAHHMQYLMGHNCSRDSLGEWIHWAGSPLCSSVGHLLNLVDSSVGSAMAVESLCAFFTFLLTLALAMALVLVVKFRKRKAL